MYECSPEDNEQVLITFKVWQQKKCFDSKLLRKLVDMAGQPVTVSGGFSIPPVLASSQQETDSAAEAAAAVLIFKNKLMSLMSTTGNGGDSITTSSAEKSATSTAAVSNNGQRLGQDQGRREPQKLTLDSYHKRRAIEFRQGSNCNQNSQGGKRSSFLTLSPSKGQLKKQRCSSCENEDGIHTHENMNPIVAAPTDVGEWKPVAPGCEKLLNSTMRKKRDEVDDDAGCDENTVGDNDEAEMTQNQATSVGTLLERLRSNV